MEFIKPDIHIDFLGKRKIAFGFSLFMILLTLVLLLWRGGPNYGVDFSGGISFCHDVIKRWICWSLNSIISSFWSTQSSNSP